MVRKPDFFIVGAPRCGTTAMYEYLRQHPEIYMPERKEPHFLGSDLRVLRKFTYYTPNLNRYLALFKEGQSKKRVGEASTLYLKSRMAASEIKEFSPHASIIIMLRNPVDMIHSLHAHVVDLGAEDIEDFERALEAETDRSRGLKIPKGCGIVDSLLYRDITRFSEQVGRYFKIFGRENVYVINYDDFRDNTPAVYGTVLNFLEVNSNFQPRFDVIHGNRQVRSKMLRHLWVRRPLFLQHALMDYVPLPVTRGVQKSLRWVYSRPTPRPPMNPQLRKSLQVEFRPEVERLSELLGQDLTHWCNE